MYPGASELYLRHMAFLSAALGNKIETEWYVQGQTPSGNPSGQVLPYRDTYTDYNGVIVLVIEYKWDINGNPISSECITKN